MNVYSHKPIPVFILQHPQYSLADRVLFAYLLYANKEGVCFLSSRSIAILVGEVGEDGSPSDQNLTNIRKARHTLLSTKTYKDGSTQSPALIHHRKPTKSGRYQDVYVVSAPPVTSGALSLMSSWGQKKKVGAHTYETVSWDKKPPVVASPSPSATKVAAPPVVDGWDLEELIGSSKETQTPEPVEPTDDLLDFADFGISHDLDLDPLAGSDEIDDGDDLDAYDDLDDNDDE